MATNKYISLFLVSEIEQKYRMTAKSFVLDRQRTSVNKEIKMLFSF